MQALRQLLCCRQVSLQGSSARQIIEFWGTAKPALSQGQDLMRKTFWTAHFATRPVSIYPSGS